MRISYVGEASGNDVTLTAVDDVPNATVISISPQEDTPYSGTFLATDSDSPILTYSIVSQPTYGTVLITDPATGVYLYTPSANCNGTDSFPFKANDASADSNVATVSITVQSVNDAPQLTRGEGTVIFNAKTARKNGPVLRLPDVAVTDPDQSPEFGVAGGTLTISVDASGKATKKNLKLNDTFGGLALDPHSE